MDLSRIHDIDQAEVSGLPNKVNICSCHNEKRYRVGQLTSIAQ